MKLIRNIALVLLIVGGLNWGLIGLFDFNLVAFLFGGQDALLARIDRIIFYCDYTERQMGIEILKGTASVTPVAPAHSATLITEPRLCGSNTSSRTTNKISFPASLVSLMVFLRSAYLKSPL